MKAMPSATAQRESALRITPRRMGESLLLRVQGKLTVATVPLFSMAIMRALRLDARLLVIDLREITDMDARGIGELVKVHTLGLQHNRPVRFLIRNGRIAHLLRLANLDDALTLLEEATDSAAREEHQEP
jgi:anti-anti-sigma factor